MSYYHHYYELGHDIMECAMEGQTFEQMLDTLPELYLVNDMVALEKYYNVCLKEASFGNRILKIMYIPIFAVKAFSWIIKAFM